jgi:hypothetical protein
MKPTGHAAVAAFFLTAITLTAAPPVFTGELTFRLHDSLEHPFIWWPRTLLEYPVQFSGPISPGQLTLTDAEGKPVPFQLSNVKPHSATVSFFSDLPSGGTRLFTLKTAPAKPSAPQVRESAEGATIVLDTGKLKIRIPASQSNPAEPPGPVMQLSRGDKWIGHSRFYSGAARVTRITTTRLESGPLFIAYRIVYDLAPKGRYSATVRALGDTEFLELHEQMENLDGARIETTWSGFTPQFRQAPNHPYAPGQEIGDPAEPIDMAQMNTHIAVAPGIGPDGELPFRLGIYQPWPAFVTGTYANFWNANTNDALGVFIDKVERWDDRDYAIWSSSPRLDLRYYWHAGSFFWKWPLANGARSTCLSFYDHALDRQAVADEQRMHAGVIGKDGARYRSSLMPTSHMLFLQNRHGMMDLNQVKDWVLEYPSAAKHPAVSFNEGRYRTPAELERGVLGSDLMAECAASGTRQNGGFGPVPSRQIGDRWVDGFNRLYDQLSEHQRTRITAALLLMAYTHAGEDYMPMRPMLSGHPNFLSDVKSVPALVAFLFPDHPMAKEWAELFRKYMELNTHYHTRPAVESWDAHAGRWTENLGTYVWGFIRPALRANEALQLSDGGNRFPTPELAEVGDWLVDALSAPFAGEPDEVASHPPDMHQWGRVLKQNGPRRIHPPQGAHAERRMPPRSMWMLGNLLERYSPLTAEHLMWAARPQDQDQEQPLTGPDPWKVFYNVPDNRGTNPHLTSAKYTGYGIVLRAAVDTPDELSIHLQQIDEGPNYRWGNQPDSGTGAIYFYARGKAWSHNGVEDTGDRATQDTDLQTNFGAFKDGKFRSVGRNVLDQPLYNLDVAQYAELRPKSYSTPEFVSRGVLLIGSDYFLTFDDVFNEAIPHRWSWFVGKYEELPFIKVLRGGGRDPEAGRTDLTTVSTKGVWYDGLGNSVILVSHRHDLDVQPTKSGATVHLDGGIDEVFRDIANGTGVVRHRKDGTLQMALIRGSRISAGGVTITTIDPELGISATFRTPSEISGIYCAPRESHVQIEGATGVLYIDGARATVWKAGTHRWQMTAGDPIPNAPRILHTENNANGAHITVEPVAGATRYRYEISRDNAKTWSPATATLTGLAEGTKVHVRAIAANATRESAPGPEYPVYIASKPPLPPDGLSIALRQNSAALIWGEVLGAAEYRLYADDRLVYRGPARTFTDAKPASQYSVSAVNGNGEGPRSLSIRADRNSWLTFDPKPGEPFRRDAVDPVYYPR